MKAWIVTSLAAGSLAVAAAGSAADITVMTQNQYLGADIAPLVEPGGDFDLKVATALQQVADNKPLERIAALAAEIRERQPQLVGLQEVFSFECTNLIASDVCSGLPFAGAFNDHLALMETELSATYEVAAKVENLHVLLPVQLVPGGDPEAVIEVIDRDVILARKGVETEVITPCLDPQECPAPPAVPAFASAVCMNPSVDGCNYKAVIYLEFLGLTIERGYVAVQAAVNGRRFIFVNTHLETREPVSFFQAAQASELTSVLAWLSGKYALPIILAGDFNSSPNDPIVVPNSPGAPPPSDEPGAKWPEVHNPYVQLAAAGLSDAWLFRPGNVPGLSCCQEADLSNHNSQVSERIDLIWSSEVPWKVKDARVVGETVNFKTKPPGRGLWPSDHGAVVATLQFR